MVPKTWLADHGFKLKYDASTGIAKISRGHRSLSIHSYSSEPNKVLNAIINFRIDRPFWGGSSTRWHNAFDNLFTFEEKSEMTRM